MQTIPQRPRLPEITIFAYASKDCHGGNPHPRVSERLSVIIPCLNDAEALAACLDRLSGQEDLQLVVADASSDDRCAAVARRAGALVVPCPSPGRGSQLNAGAARASGEVLIFNHADTRLTIAHLISLRERLRSPDVVGGAFYRDVAWQYPSLAWTKSISRAYMRRFGILYGDQTIFIRRDAFEKLGRFGEIPIMEDVEFSQRLRKLGRDRVVLLDPPIRASVRRFKRLGFLRNKLQNTLILLVWRLGLVTPDQIYAYYYGRQLNHFPNE